MVIAVADNPTSLEIEIRRIIRIAGPMSVAKYMELCLTHPQHGYYARRDPFGKAGDFTTSPEISQMFGELIGLWAASVWQLMGEPNRINLVELGPGRGTMMADMLRAAKILPAFDEAIAVQLVESSPVLREHQREKLADTGKSIVWHDTLADVSTAPAIYIANEFFDALPIRQAIKQSDGWHERTIEIAPDDSLQFGFNPRTLSAFEETIPPSARDAAIGAVFEWQSPLVAIELGRRISRHGAALIIDYGHMHSAIGETLQAVRAHKYDSPFAVPGSADLSAHVDFEALAAAIGSVGTRTEAPIDQGTFLRRLGIATRAGALKVKSDKKESAVIDAALERLTSSEKTGMGRLFKVLGVAHRALPVLPGFDG
jgi:SAM-dependent MidA family methyltransferase